MDYNKIIYIKDFKKEFPNLGEICNNILIIAPRDEDFYIVQYDINFYRRFKKISKLAPNNKIDTYIKVINYCINNEVCAMDVLIRDTVRELSKEIDKRILKKCLSLAHENDIGNIETDSF